MRENFTDFEKQVYDYIKEQGEVLVHNLPKKMMGAIPDLKNAGYLKTYRKPTNPWASTKQTFVKALEKKEGWVHVTDGEISKKNPDRTDDDV